MVVQYKHRSHYICNYLRQQSRVPVCQYIPTTPVDTRVVEAFFDALSPLELDAYQHVREQQHQAHAQLEQVYRQQLQRLRYQATLAQRQFDHVDPENRLVAAELEQRWEQALRAVKQAEAEYDRQHTSQARLPELPPDVQAAFRQIGQTLPQIWNSSLLSRPQKKALLRALIDKVVIHRSARDLLQTRIVGKGGATTVFQIPIPVGTFSDLSFANELETAILPLARQGAADEEIAAQLSTQGYRSPMHSTLLPSTVRTIRLKHRILRTPHQSHPCRVPGYLSVSQLARQLGVSRHWLYDRIHNGSIQIAKDIQSNSYLFPDHPETLEQLRHLREGKLTQVCFETAEGTESRLLEAPSPLQLTRRNMP